MTRAPGPLETWKQELEKPTAAFFSAFAGLLAESHGLRDGIREAAKLLAPRVDWEAYQPHIPHACWG